MTLRILPSFWFLAATGIAWVVVGVTMGLPVACLLGLGVLLSLWQAFVSALGSAQPSLAIKGQLRQDAPLGTPIDLRLSVPDGTLGDLRFDYSGVPVEGLSAPHRRVGQDLEWRVQGLTMGPLSIHGLWVSAGLQGDLFESRQYHSLEGETGWTLPAWEQQEIGLHAQDSLGPYGEAREWQYGDQLKEIDPRASVRMGRRIVRPRQREVLSPTVSIVGPVEGLFTFRKRNLQGYLTGLSDHLAEPSARPREVVLFDLDGNLTYLRGVQLNDWGKTLATLCLRVANGASLATVRKADPELIREHLVASGRLSASHWTQPGALLRALKQGLKGIHRESVVEAYWRKFGFKGKRFPEATPSLFDEVWESILDHYREGAEFHWWPTGSTLNDELMVKARRVWTQGEERN